MQLSIVLPCHNEATRLPLSLERIARWLDAQSLDAEILVVDNASSDTTADVARTFASRDPRVLLLDQPVPGKGAAVRTGMLAARGQVALMSDADLSVPIEQTPAFLDAIEAGADVAIASREGPSAQRHGEPGYRHIMGRVFNLLTRAAGLAHIPDTQCGFKAFHAPAAFACFSRLTLTGFSFDVEALLIARRLGFRLEVIPVPWFHAPGSQVRPIVDAARMFRDVLLIALRRQRRAPGPLARVAPAIPDA